MDSSEPREPSYYEVALTNRQVLVAFVVLLTCLLAAFLSGVWVGRGVHPEPAARTAPAPAAAPAAAPIEQLTFFSDKAPGKNGGAKAATTAPAPAGKPATAAAAGGATDATDATDATETMRKTLEAEMAKSREGGGAATAAAPSAAAPEPAPATTVPLTPGARATQKPASAANAPAPRPAAPAAASSTTPSPPAAAAPAGAIWIQVYSSTNGARAQQIAASLRKAKYAVTVAEIPRGGQIILRVRVGPYETRAGADAAATKLRREQKLDTWVTDTP